MALWISRVENIRFVPLFNVIFWVSILPVSNSPDTTMCDTFLEISYKGHVQFPHFPKYTIYNSYIHYVINLSKIVNYKYKLNYRYKEWHYNKT